MVALLFSRLMLGLYELLILIALWMPTVWVYLLCFGEVQNPSQRLTLQALLWLVAGVYFVFSWVNGGQTLAMKAWKVRLERRDGHPLHWRDACQRYVLASFFWLLGALTLLWMLITPSHQYLHDVLSGTQLVPVKH